MSEAHLVDAEALGKGDTIRFHFADFEVLGNDRMQRLTLRPVGSEHNQIVELVRASDSMCLIQSEEQPSEAASAAPTWLLLRPGRHIDGVRCWEVVRMPEDAIYGRINREYDDFDEIVGHPQITETESETLRVACEKVLNGGMDITLPYRIDSDVISSP